MQLKHWAKSFCIKSTRHFSSKYGNINNVNLHERRVVCTGIGITCPLGHGAKFAWKQLISGEIGIAYNKREGFEKIPSKVAGFVPNGKSEGKFDYDNFTSKGQLKYLSKSMIYALAASEEALNQSVWHPSDEEDKQRTGVAIGCGMVDLETITETSNNLNNFGYRKVSPYFVPKILTNMAAGHVSIKYGFQGPNHAVSTACTTGLHAVGDSFRFIRNGDADVMVCGGTEAAIVPVSVAGFARARALSTLYTDFPKKSSRPFDKHRDGFVIGEGAGILILEELNHALQRKASILGEILGYGLSGDAHHMTAGKEDGTGAFLSMKAAIRDANLEPSDIQYVNAHATSTPVGDKIENRAIKKCFGEHAYKMKVSSFKGALGHLLGAAGAVETAFTILALREKIIPPTMNLETLDQGDGFDLDYVPNIAINYEPVHGARRVAVKNSFGFGGTNASLCVAEYVQ